MGKKKTIELDRALIEIEERQGYLFVVESGRLSGMRDVRRYHSEVDQMIRATGITKGLIDARGEVGDGDPDQRDAMWEWLLDPSRSFEVTAFVLPAGMAVARVNMTALAKGANLRAFETVSAAQRWLARGGRPTAGFRSSSQNVPGASSTIRPPSERPGTEDDTSVA